ncbi:MAG: hypothetical protein ACP6IU_10785 [Candidatus Asgardarchaeia archaeon]
MVVEMMLKMEQHDITALRIMFVYYFLITISIAIVWIYGSYSLPSAFTLNEKMAVLFSLDFLFIVLLLLSLYAVSKIFHKPFSLQTMGIKKQNISISFLWVFVLMAPFPILFLLIDFLGFTQFALEAWIPLLLVNEKPTFEIFLLYSAHFLIIGFIERTCIIAFLFRQAQKLLKPKVAIIITTILWYFIHKMGSPMMFDPLTFIFTGFIPVIVYSKSDNSIPLIIAYPLYEGPLWWIVATVFGLWVLKVYVILLIISGLISLGILRFYIKVAKN